MRAQSREPVQLGLFSPERMEVGEGFEALRRLDFDEALSVLRDVLGRHPECADAAEGISAAEHWRRVTEAARSGDCAHEADQLWRALAECPPRLAPGGLRQTMMEHIVELLDDAGVELIPPDLCAGHVLLELGRAAEAEERLRRAVQRHDEQGRGLLFALLGNALWRLDRRSAARAVYTRGLLSDPDERAWQTVDDTELARLIEARGAAGAPVFGWLEGILPLLADDAEDLGDSREAELYRLLGASESARGRGDHGVMVDLRMRLRNLAPEVFDAYMERLERAAYPRAR